MKLDDFTELADEIPFLQDLLKLKGATAGELEGMLRTLAMKGPRGTIHTRYPDHDTVLAVSVMYAGNEAFEGDNETSFGSMHVKMFLIQYAIALISEGGQSRKEFVELAKALANVMASTAERLREQMGGVLQGRRGG